jgi:uncharacterized protein
MNADDFVAIALRNPANDAILDELLRLELHDAWLVSGCLVQTAWNVLTGRPVDYGINDYDVFYFHADTSWDAEDAVIRSLSATAAELNVTIEARNQARVHLWYPSRFGYAYPPLTSSRDGIDQFLTRNTKVGIQRTRAGDSAYAPDGFDDIANLLVTPNPTPHFSAERYAQKAARWKSLWPELKVIAPKAEAGF